MVIQIKNIKLKNHDFLDNAYVFREDDLYRNFIDELRSSSNFLKNIRQCYGGARTLLESSDTITLKNEAGLQDIIELNQINKVYCLAYYHGDQLRHDISV